MFNFKLLYLIAQLFGISVVILTVIWVVKFMGLVWDIEDQQLFNWHSIFMVTGMIFFYGNSLLVFRAFQSTSKHTVKIAHATIHTASIVCITLGLGVEFVTHYYHTEADLYSLHSWIGVGTVLIFVFQLVFGALCFISASISENVKVFYLPIHVFFGTLCFVMAIATSLIGLNQNARFNMKYSELPGQGVLINIIGVLMVIYGAMVVFLVTKPSFKRGAVQLNKEPAT